MTTVLGTRPGMNGVAHAYGNEGNRCSGCVRYVSKLAQDLRAGRPAPNANVYCSAINSYVDADTTDMSVDCNDFEPHAPVRRGNLWSIRLTPQ